METEILGIYIIIGFVLGINNGLITCFVQSTIANASTIQLPITYNSYFIPVCGGGHPDLISWPCCYKINLSSVNIASRGTVGFSQPTYCLTIGY